MSKSLGNVLTIPMMVEQGYDPLDLRYYLLSVHYRTNLKFSWKGMDDSKKARKKILAWMDDVKADGREGRTSGNADAMIAQSFDAFTGAMNSDLNTPAALGEIFTVMNHYYAHRPFDETTHHQMIDFIEKVRYTFGCFEETEEGIPMEVQELLSERATARATKDFAESDRLRDAIAAFGYDVKDTKDGQQLRKK